MTRSAPTGCMATKASVLPLYPPRAVKGNPGCCADELRDVETRAAVAWRPKCTTLTVSQGGSLPQLAC